MCSEITCASPRNAIDILQTGLKNGKLKRSEVIVPPANDKTWKSEFIQGKGIIFRLIKNPQDQLMADIFAREEDINKLILWGATYPAEKMHLKRLILLFPFLEKYISPINEIAKLYLSHLRLIEMPPLNGQEHPALTGYRTHLEPFSGNLTIYSPRTAAIKDMGSNRPWYPLDHPLIRHAVTSIMRQDLIDWKKYHFIRQPVTIPNQAKSSSY